MTLPTVFLPHGAGPCFFMEWTRGPADTWDRTAAYLRGLIDSLPERPTAVVAFRDTVMDAVVSAIEFGRAT